MSVFASYLKLATVKVALLQQLFQRFLYLFCLYEYIQFITGLAENFFTGKPQRFEKGLIDIGEFSFLHTNQRNGGQVAGKGDWIFAVTFL